MLTEVNCASCSHCTADTCSHSVPDDVEMPEGGRLVLGALLLFILPVVWATAGAAWSATTAGGPLPGAIAGLLLGMAAAVLAARVPRNGKECP